MAKYRLENIKFYIDEYIDLDTGKFDQEYWLTSDTPAGDMEGLLSPLQWKITKIEDKIKKDPYILLTIEGTKKDINAFLYDTSNGEDSLRNLKNLERQGMKIYKIS